MVPVPNPVSYQEAISILASPSSKREERQREMTVHQAPLVLRSYFGSFIAFFLICFSFSILLNHIQNQTQNQVESSIDNAQENQNYTLFVDTQDESPNQASFVDSQDQSPFLVDVDTTNRRNEPEERIISIGRRGGGRDNGSINRDDDEKDKCDFSVGRWVYDNVTRPLYSGPKCKFMHDEVACDKYGRNDTRYQHWRWQPKGCDLPR